MTDYTLLARQSMLGNERLFFRRLSVIGESREQTSWFEAGDLWFGWFRGKSNPCKREPGKEILKSGQLSANPGNLPAKLGHITVKILSKGGKRKSRPAKAETPTTNAGNLTANAEAQTMEALTNCGKARSLTTNAETHCGKVWSLTAKAETMTTDAETNCGKVWSHCGKAGSLTANVWSLTTKAETMTTKAGTLTTDAGSKCGNVLVCTANVWAVTGKIKSFATKAPRHQEFFVAIFTAGESDFRMRRLIWQFQ